MEEIMGEIITINFLNIHLDYASIFWNAEGQGGQEKEGKVMRQFC
jgi:hypothetical protein